MTVPVKILEDIRPLCPVGGQPVGNHDPQGFHDAVGRQLLVELLVVDEEGRLNHAEGGRGQVEVVK